ncbi:ABC transporter permease [Amycolatopsis sp. FBCC-B4732]|uniref:ABC transporter permease n=1 Tax=Amycolatopsis sp. FBCC-B4732 TaxID=3079339 RepID=UPI001FF44E85|nr:ABC transporter permease [Amycolatopsis sp. FBCC-B4732]UOX87322.1 ABC transporter permease [Amycolatopsis sp. FBCC-B4732]
MNLLAVERIKLFSTRSPWWCALIALALGIGFAAIISGATPADSPVTLSALQFGGTQFGIAVVMVLAALAVTTEYRFNTIRTTFQAVPHRSPALIAKAVVVALVALVIGEIAAFGALGLGMLMRPNDGIGLHSTQDWLNVAGLGPVFAISAVLAVAIGVLIRHSAGAIALLLIYNLAVEDLIRLIPKIGAHIHEWMPFNVANKFLRGSAVVDGPSPSDSPLSPGWALAYFAGIAIVFLLVALGVAKKRDA